MYHHFHTNLRTLVVGQFVMELKAVEGEVMNLLFSFAAENGTYRYEQTENHIVHYVMPLYEHICIVGSYSECGEFSFQFLNLALGFGMSALEVMKLFLHFLCQVLKAAFGITGAYLVQL